MTSSHWLKWIFMLSGVGVMTARTGQQGGIYLFLFLVPMFAGAYKKERNAELFRGGEIFFFLYVVFAMFDIVHWTFGGESYQLHANSLIKGKLSSLLGCTGVLWMLLGKKTLPFKSRLTIDANHLFACFWDGVWLGSLLLLGLGVVQVLTGFDFVSANAYRPDRLMANGLYRATGLSNHPLSLAGMSLGIMTLAATLGLSSMNWQATLSGFGVMPRQSSLFPWRTKFACVAICQGTLVLLSGSRTPSAIALVIGLICLGIVAWRHRSNLLIQVLVGSILVAAGLGFWKLGVATRFAEALQSGMGGDQRLFFWKAHWAMFLEHPWIGHGRQFLETVARDRTFESLFPGQQVVHYNAHNLYLEVLAMGGIFGGVTLTGLFCLLALKLRVISRHSEIGPVLYQALIWAFIANLVHGLTQNSLFDSAAIAPYVYTSWLLALMMLWQSPKARF